MRKVWILCLLFFFIICAETVYIFHTVLPVPSTPKKPLPQPLLAYTFPNLHKSLFPQTPITLGKIVYQTDTSTAQIFYFSTPKQPQKKTLERVSGLMNFPNKPGTYPVIIMFRGFIPEENYHPGAGTQPVASVLARNGFITLAPDFLGFGESSSPSADSFENRFQTYTTAATLLASLPTLNKGLHAQYATLSADMSHIGIWGHSNGGHIALATLAITGVTYPTVLWAPVSTSFPYSILYYTNESDDQGKVLRKVLSQFETIYNTDLFSPPLYYSWIHAALQIHQGLADQEVPYWWTDALVKTLQKNNLSVDYHTYPNADHNFLPGGWSEAVDNTMQFFKLQFAK